MADQMHPVDLSKLQANVLVIYKWWGTVGRKGKLVACSVNWETGRVVEKWKKDTPEGPVYTWKPWDMRDPRQGQLMDITIHWGSNWVEETWTGVEETWNGVEGAEEEKEEKHGEAQEEKHGEAQEDKHEEEQADKQ